MSVLYLQITEDISC